MSGAEGRLYHTRFLLHSEFVSFAGAAVKVVDPNHGEVVEMEEGKVHSSGKEHLEEPPQGILRDVHPKEKGEPQDIHEETPSKLDGSGKA